MSSGPGRDPHANTPSHHPFDPRDPYRRTLSDQPVSLSPSSSQQPNLYHSGDQAGRPQTPYGQYHRSSPMALQPPLLPSITPSYGHHRGGFSLDSSSSRGSLPSPREPQRRLEEQGRTPDTSPTWPTRSGSLQKRAFRQRRKEPSCDACRERKVKCDATDSRSCTECANRGVRCQFTKDTNRRMSSIKQVQELERQLAHMRQQNERLRLLLRPEDRMELDIPMEQSPAPEVGTSRPEDLHRYARACRNTRRYARGIFRPPPARRIQSSSPTVRLDRSILPNQQESAHLVEACRNSFVRQLAIVDWDSFREMFHSLYEPSSADFPRPWMALFWAVLAFGSLQSGDERMGLRQRHNRSHDFMIRSSEYLSFSERDVTLDHCRAALLLSVYHVEANQRSTGWAWLSTSVTFAFDLGLQDPSNQPDTRDAEQKLQVWWSVYSWERLLCLEMSQPSLIDDDDCEVLNQSSELSGHSEQSFQGIPATQGLPSLFQSVIDLMKLYRSIRRVTRSLSIPQSTLAAFENRLEPISASYPRPRRLGESAGYDTDFFTFTILVSNARLVLNRQNLSPACSMEQRSNALESCITATHATMRCIRDSRVNSDPGEQAETGHDVSSSPWAAWVRTVASSLTCTHLWRCILVLAFALDFESALVCTKASAAVDETREINLACGRHLVFFLELLTERMGRGEHHRQMMLDDAEMLAYLSADSQANSRAAWIWQGEDAEGTGGGGEATRSTPVGREARETPAPDETTDVWDRVDSLLQHLERERTKQRPLPPLNVEAGRAASEAQETTGEAVPTTRATPAGESNKRMSIAHIT